MLDQRLHQVLQILPTDQLCSPRARLRVAIAPLTADWVSPRKARYEPKCSDNATAPESTGEETEGEVPENTWFLRYEKQREANAATEERIARLEQEVVAMQKQSGTAQGVSPVANMSEKDMKLLLKKMERQVVALKGELKDYEWRLDQESVAHHKALAEKRDLALQLSRTSGARDEDTQKWEPIHKRRSMPKVTNHKP